MNERAEVLARRWRTSLEQWAIPPEILEQAPASPWIHPPKLFRLAEDDLVVPETPSFALARQALSGGGTVLDVGCGGGRSSLPLAPPATEVTGVDESEAMLRQFVEAASARGVECHTRLGKWPDIAAEVLPADVVVCHHVVYNVADIVPFVTELTRHARRRVVVELPVRHPQSSVNPLWEHFWGLVRPTEPTAAMFTELLEQLGLRPTSELFLRPERPGPLPRAELVAFMRQRLCLTPDRDDEVDQLLGEHPALSPDEVWSVAWDTG